MKWSLQVKAIRCGRGCKGCPHGHYYYAYRKEQGKVLTKYLGKERPRGAYLEDGRLKWVDCLDELPPLLELPPFPLFGLPEEEPKKPVLPFDQIERFTVNDALIALGFVGYDPKGREQARKRVFNLAARAGLSNQERLTLKNSFATLCKHFNWKLPKD